MKKILIADTTLRDGEQTPGVNFNTREKVRIALQLAKWGVDSIEAGFPIASEGDAEAVKAIADTVKGPVITALCRARKNDIDRAYEALKGAEKRAVHIFLATSPIHMQYKLKKNEAEILEQITEHVAYATKYFDEVEFSPEDASRSNIDFLQQSVQAAVDAGAKIINITDTVGYSNPFEFQNLMKTLVAGTKNTEDVVFSTHCHNDLGMAVANSLSAISAGATRIEGTINGIGERAGNASLEEVATALEIRKEFFDVATNINLVETKATSDLVALYTGIPIPKNKAVVGGNAYSHESGIHQDGVLKNPETYEIINPNLVGVTTNSLPLGKLSGKHAFSEKLTELEYSLTKEEIDTAFKKFKALADKKKEVSDSDIRAIVEGQMAADKYEYELKELQLTYNSLGHQHAEILVVKNDADKITRKGEGAGSVQAIYNAIDDIFNQQTELLDYSIESVTTGIDSQAEVRVLVRNNVTGNQFDGVGIDFDVLQASAFAYLEAKIKVERDNKLGGVHKRSYHEYND
jgi:2-isopropylmalate synthase